MMFIHSIRGRLTALYTLVLAAVLIVTGMITYASIRRQLGRSTDRALAAMSRDFVRALIDEAHEQRGVVDAETTRAVVTDLRDSTRVFAIFDESGRDIAVSSTDVDVEKLRTRIREHRYGYGTARAARHRLRYFITPATVLGSRMVIVVGQTLDVQRELLADVRGAMIVGIPLALLIASAAGYVLARKSLAPVAAMSEKASAIGAADLGERIDVENPRDELGALASTLNGLLQRLEEAFASQRRFMADASHELRTPVAILQGELDVALSRDLRDPAEYRESLEIMRKSVRRLARIVGDLFLIARSDAGEVPVQRERFYLDEVVAQTVRSFRTLAAERGVTLTEEHDDELPFEGDSDLIQRMVGNLIENAIRHTPAGRRVQVETRRSTITVRDEGPGIPHELHESIFHRFVRADTSRTPLPTPLGSGAGLGLPIARWIAETHGGTLRLERSGVGGSVFVVHLKSTLLIDRTPPEFG